VSIFNSFKAVGPTIIQFSMGRSSGVMAEKVMEAHDGKRPEDTFFIVENTGKEDEASLKFADDCDKHWGLGLIWLEYTDGGGYKQVTYETASRNGEPFEAVIRQRGGVLPNPRSRYCSSELKTRTVHRFIRNELGWSDWDTMLGIRADEPSRVSKFRSNPHPETKSETIVLPLAETNVTAKDVGNFWKCNSFDLGLPNMNGKTMHGNCDLCFLKPTRQVVSLIQEKPERAVWWAKQEQAAEAVAHGAGNRFRNDRPSYAQMLNFTDRQGDMFDPNEQAISCFCGD